MSTTSNASAPCPVETYWPAQSAFSRQLPAYRQLRRHHLPPRGETSRYPPSRSNIRKVLAAGLAFRAALSVSDIWGQLPSRFGQLPPRLPPDVNGKLRRSQDPINIKKPAFYAGFVEVLGSLRILSDRLNGG